MWIIKTDYGILGQYDNYEDAYFAATINLGYDGWEILRVYG